MTATAFQTPEEEVERHGLRELRGATPRPVERVEPALELGLGPLEERLRRRRSVRGQVGLLGERLRQALPRRDHLESLVAPRPRRPGEDLPERREPVVGLGWEVGAARERLAAGWQQAAQRPTGP